MDVIDTVLTVAVSAVVVVFIVWAVVRAHRARPYTGAESLVGEEGEAVTDIDPKGQVFVHGEYWRAKSASPIEKGEEIRVLGSKGLLLIVEEKTKGVEDGSDHV